jgi:hypothetical protein
MKNIPLIEFDYRKELLQNAPLSQGFPSPFLSILIPTTRKHAPKPKQHFWAIWDRGGKFVTFGDTPMEVWRKFVPSQKKAARDAWKKLGYKCKPCVISPTKVKP